MGRKIRYSRNYYEDNYIKYECQSCKRCFIVGEALSRGMDVSCPYCRSAQIETGAIATEDCTEDMDMGCLGLYYSVYDDGRLMLYTEREFRKSLVEAVVKDVPLETVTDCIALYCSKRDGR